MNMPKITKKDKRSHAEVKMDELIDKLADQATTPEEARKVLGMMKDREEIKEVRTPWYNQQIVSNIVTAAVGLVQIAAIINAEDVKILSKTALGFVHKGRLR